MAIAMVAGACSTGAEVVVSQPTSETVDPTPSTSACDTAVADGPNVIVFLEPDALPETIAEIGELVAADDPTARFVSQAEAFVEFNEELFADDPAASLVEPDQLPSSYRLAVDSARVHQTAQRYTELPGVNRVITAGPTLDFVCDAGVLRPMVNLMIDLVCRRVAAFNDEPDSRFVDGLNLIVFLDPDVDEDDLATIEAAAAIIDPTAISVSQDEAYAELEDLFADQPQITDLVEPSVLPPSIRLKVASEALSTTADEFRSLRGVREVVVDDRLELDEECP